MIKFIDTDGWKRKVPYENFIKYSNPIVSMSARLDVTELISSCKRRGTSFFSDFTFIASKCLNEIDEFRLRLVGGKVALYDSIDPNYIVLNDNDVISTCRTKMSNSYADFYTRCRKDIEDARKNVGVSVFNKGDNGVFYISCIKWVDLVSFSNPFDYADKDGCSIPRLTWGKVVDESGRKKMTFDVAAHHALIDGEPICRGINSIQLALDRADKFLAEDNK